MAIDEARRGMRALYRRLVGYTISDAAVRGRGGEIKAPLDRPEVRTHGVETSPGQLVQSPNDVFKSNRCGGSQSTAWAHQDSNNYNTPLIILIFLSLALQFNSQFDSLSNHPY